MEHTGDSERVYGWRFRASPLERSREANERWRARLEAAVRVAHAARIRFELVISSGRSASVSLEVRGAPAARWANRAFLSSYPPGTWNPVVVTPHVRTTVAVARAGPGRARVEASSSRPWGRADAIRLAMSLRRPELSLRWQLSPRTPSLSDRWRAIGGPPVPLTAPRRAIGPRPGSPRESEPPPTGVGIAPWASELRLEGEPGRWDPAERTATIRAVEGAFADCEEMRPRFVASDLRRGTCAPTIVLSERSVVDSLPRDAQDGRGSPDGDSRTTLGLPLGRDDLGRVVSAPLTVHEGRHLAVLGETGMGKSSLLEAIARRVAGSSTLVVLDPLGETVRAIATEVSCPGVDVLEVSAARTHPRINALEGVGIGPDAGIDRRRGERRLNDLVRSLQRVRSGRYADSGFWGPRLEEMLARALAAAAENPSGTLEDAHTLLATGGRLGRPETGAPSSARRELSDRIRQRPDDAEGARRLLYEVVRSDVLRSMLCARTPDVRVSELVAPGRAVLISGDAAQVGESTARYLLSVYLAIIWSELIARPSSAKVFVILDEAQWFAHESLAELLRLGRRANVHTVVATQAVASLPEVVREAVWTNVADLVAFRGSPVEAREFARAVPSVSIESLMALPRGRALALLGKGEEVRWIRTSRPVGRLDRVSSRAMSEPPMDPAEGDGPLEAIEPSATDRLTQQISGAAGSEAPVRVWLDSLRGPRGSDDRAVRELGSRLGRSGALVSSGRDARGPFWDVRPERTGPDPPPGPPAGGAGSRASQPS